MLGAKELGGSERRRRGERDGRDQAAPATLRGVELSGPPLGLLGGGRGGLAKLTRGSSAGAVDGVLRRRAYGPGLLAGFLLSRLTGATAALGDGVDGGRDCAADTLTGCGRMLANCLDGRARQPVGLPHVLLQCLFHLALATHPLVLSSRGPFADVQRRTPQMISISIAA